MRQPVSNSREPDLLVSASLENSFTMPISTRKIQAMGTANKRKRSNPSIA